MMARRTCAALLDERCERIEQIIEVRPDQDLNQHENAARYGRRWVWLPLGGEVGDRVTVDEYGEARVRRDDIEEGCPGPCFERPRDQARTSDERAYLAEVDALPHRTYRIPGHHGSGLCWDCRCLAVSGTGPIAEQLRHDMPPDALAAMRAEVRGEGRP